AWEGADQLTAIESIIDQIAPTEGQALTGNGRLNEQRVIVEAQAPAVEARRRQGGPPGFPARPGRIDDFHFQQGQRAEIADAGRYRKALEQGGTADGKDFAVEHAGRFDVAPIAGAIADAKIELLIGKFAEAVGGDQPQLDIRVLGIELAEPWHQ